MIALRVSRAVGAARRTAEGAWVTQRHCCEIGEHTHVRFSVDGGAVKGRGAMARREGEAATASKGARGWTGARWWKLVVKCSAKSLMHFQDLGLFPVRGYLGASSLPLLLDLGSCKHW